MVLERFSEVFANRIIHDFIKLVHSGDIDIDVVEFMVNRLNNNSNNHWGNNMSNTNKTNLNALIEKMNLKFKIFNNGEELLNYLFKTDPNGIYAIITDLEMPKKSGFEVIKEVKNSEKYSKIPIIVNSTMSGKSNEEMAKSLNADGFISKNKPKEIEYYLKRLLN